MDFFCINEPSNEHDEIWCIDNDKVSKMFDKLLAGKSIVEVMNHFGVEDYLYTKTITLDEILNHPAYKNNSRFQGKDAIPQIALDYLTSEMLKYISHRNVSKVLSIYYLLLDSDIDWNLLSENDKNCKEMQWANIENGSFFKINN